MSDMPVSLDAAVEATRTGDLWLFRGRAPADRAIQTLTNSPVNHVGMALVLEDLPPLMWHAELGRSLPDRWSGNHHRGVQLHDLRDSVEVWGRRYGQRAWLRQLEPAVSRAAEDAALRAVARLDGTPFPSTARLTGRWLTGRVPRLPRRGAGGRSDTPAGGPGPADGLPADGLTPAGMDFLDAARGFAGLRSLARSLRARTSGGGTAGTGGAGGVGGSTGGAGAGGGADGGTRGAGGGTGERGATRRAAARLTAVEVDNALETAYCAEVVALTYQAMGLLPPGRRANWYDPGRFWSGDDLRLAGGFALGAEIAIALPPT